MTPTPSAFREIAAAMCAAKSSMFVSLPHQMMCHEMLLEALPEFAPRIAALVSEKRIINELVAENEKLHRRIGEMEDKA